MELLLNNKHFSCDSIVLQKVSCYIPRNSSLMRKRCQSAALLVLSGEHMCCLLKQVDTRSLMMEKSFLYVSLLMPHKTFSQIMFHDFTLALLFRAYSLLVISLPMMVFRTVARNGSFRRMYSSDCRGQ